MVGPAMAAERWLGGLLQDLLAGARTNWMWPLSWEQLLQLGALVLSVVNGLILVRVHIRDKARLRVTPVHPETYQWWFSLPPGKSEGHSTRRVGFVVYVGVANKGYRAVTIDRWRLRVKSVNGQTAELKALTMPEPTVDLGEIVKVFPVLGQRGASHLGEMRVDSGDSTSGMALYVHEWVGSDAWGPVQKQGEIRGQFVLHDVFGGRAKCWISFRERSFAQMEQVLPGLAKLVAAVDTGWGPQPG